MVLRELKTTALLAAGVALVGANRIALRAGLRRRIDGWRRGAGLVLRGEAAHFTLSAFGLGVEGGATRATIGERLDQFLRNERAAHVRVVRGPHEDRAETTGGPCYSLNVVPAVRGPARFVPPLEWEGEPRSEPALPAGAVPLLNIVCRTDGPTTDLWMRINHVGADGVPMQELLNRLEAAWGQPGSTVFPGPDEFAPFEAPRPIPGRPELAQAQAFLDFSPLLAWRSRENARLPRPMTVAAALQWCLARRPGFARSHMGSTVEVAPRAHLQRGVGVVVVRPADYPSTPQGLAQYAMDFGRNVELTRTRASASCKTLDALAFAPAGVARALLHRAVERGGSAFGDLGLTILKDARVFVAPIGDVAHTAGFVSVGSMSLPTAKGSPVGCLWIKGPRERIAASLSDIRAAIQSCPA